MCARAHWENLLYLFPSLFGLDIEEIGQQSVCTIHAWDKLWDLYISSLRIVWVYPCIWSMESVVYMEPTCSWEKWACCPCACIFWCTLSMMAANCRWTTTRFGWSIYILAWEGFFLKQALFDEDDSLLEVAILSQEEEDAEWLFPSAQKVKILRSLNRTQSPWAPKRLQSCRICTSDGKWMKSNMPVYKDLLSKSYFWGF